MTQYQCSICPPHFWNHIFVRAQRPTNPWLQYQCSICPPHSQNYILVKAQRPTSPPCSVLSDLQLFRAHFSKGSEAHKAHSSNDSVVADLPSYFGPPNFPGGSEAHKPNSLHINIVSTLPNCPHYLSEKAQRPTNPNTVYYVTSPTV